MEHSQNQIEKAKQANQHQCNNSQMSQIYRSKDYDDWIADVGDGNTLED